MPERYYSIPIYSLPLQKRFLVLISMETTDWKHITFLDTLTILQRYEFRWKVIFFLHENHFNIPSYFFKTERLIGSVPVMKYMFK